MSIQAWQEIAEIQTAACVHYGVSRDDMLSGRRSTRLLRPRFVAIWIVRQSVGVGLVDIGFAFGRRDHSTIINALRRMTEFLKCDERLWEDVQTVRISVAGADAPGADSRAMQARPCEMVARSGRVVQSGMAGRVEKTLDSGCNRRETDNRRIAGGA